MDGKPRDTLQYKPDLECKKVLKKIDMARKSKNLSIPRLAEKAGIASSTLNEMLHGKTAPQLYTLYKICNAMGIPISEFLEDTRVDVNDIEIFRNAHTIQKGRITNQLTKCRQNCRRTDIER